METFSALLAICAGNSPVHGEYPAKRPVTRSFDVYFDMHPNTRLSKQSWGHRGHYDVSVMIWYSTSDQWFDSFKTRRKQFGLETWLTNLHSGWETYFWGS